MNMRRFAPLLIILVALLVGFATAVAWTYYDLVIRERPLSEAARAAMHPDTLAGYDAMWRGDHEAAVALWRQREKLNDPVALYYLGNAYADGDGVPQDWALAHKHLERSAELGNAKSWTYLGLLYSSRIGGPVNVQKAVEYSIRGGDLGYPQGYANVGVFYRDGVGVNKDPEIANNWFSKAAAHDHCKSHNMVAANILFRDEETAINRELASYHFRRAKLLGCEVWIGRVFAQIRFGISVE